MESFQDELVEIIAQESGLDATALMTSKGLMSSGLLDSLPWSPSLPLLKTGLAEKFRHLT